MLTALNSATAEDDDDWPHWRGADRNGICAEQSEAGKWPPGDPAWTANVGEGASSPLIWRGHVYCIGWRDERDQITCLDAATGKVQWRRDYKAPKYGRHAVGDKGMYRGVTATPEIDTESGLLFTLGCDGELACWNLEKRGERVWHLQSLR